MGCGITLACREAKFRVSTMILGSLIFLSELYWEYKDKIPTLVIRKWVTTSIMLPNPFDVADAELAASRATNPEDAPRLANTFAF
jgi:hypothetical protein